MSKYKLSPDQIEDRISLLGSKYGNGAFLKDVRQLLEEATGEKIPEPFDESKVESGTVWKNKFGVSVVIIETGVGHFTLHVVEHPYVNTPHPFRRELERASLVRFLKYDSSYRYIGQFNFKAGLPKEAA